VLDSIRPFVGNLALEKNDSRSRQR
jgi:hypothetical protein